MKRSLYTTLITIALLSANAVFSQQPTQLAASDLQISKPAELPPEETTPLDIGMSAAPTRTTLLNALPFGEFYINYQAIEHLNSTFFASWKQALLVRYSDDVLFMGKLLLANLGVRTALYMPELWVAYTVNDWLTIKAGEFELPIGDYQLHTVYPYINKMPTDPMIRNLSMVTVPLCDFGVEFSGALEFCARSSWLKEAFFTYQLWIGNGVYEQFGIPIGSGDYYFGNSFDNNSTPSGGGRVAFWQNADCVLGLSGMVGQWNNNRKAFSPGIAPGKNLLYWAWAVDLRYRFWERMQLMGEYLYAKHEFIHEDLLEHGFWAQWSFYLDPLAKAGTCWHHYLEKTELVVRGGAVWSEMPGRDGHEVSLGLNYFIYTTLQVKTAYDWRWGDPARNANQFTIRFNFAY